MTESVPRRAAEQGAGLLSTGVGDPSARSVPWDERPRRSISIIQRGWGIPAPAASRGISDLRDQGQGLGQGEQE